MAKPSNIPPKQVQQSVPDRKVSPVKKPFKRKAHLTQRPLRDNGGLLALKAKLITQDPDHKFYENLAKAVVGERKDKWT